MSILIIGWMRFEAKRNDTPRKRIEEFAKNIFGIAEKDEDVTAIAGIQALADWFDKIGTPTSFAKANIPSDEIEKLADDALATAKSWEMPDYHSKEEIIEILKLCL